MESKDLFLSYRDSRKGTGGRERRKRAVRLIVMYISAEMWRGFSLPGNFLSKCFHCSFFFLFFFCVLKPSVIETRFRIFWRAKYCSSLCEHLCWWRRSVRERGWERKRESRGGTSYSLFMLLLPCFVNSFSLHSATQCLTVELLIRELELRYWEKIANHFWFSFDSYSIWKYEQ